MNADLMTLSTKTFTNRGTDCGSGRQICLPVLPVDRSLRNQWTHPLEWRLRLYLATTPAQVSLCRLILLSTLFFGAIYGPSILLFIPQTITY